MPSGWTSSNAIYSNISMTGKSVELTQNGYLSQTVEIKEKNYSEYTLSVYSKNTGKVKLLIELELLDTTSESKEIIATSYDEWTQISISLSTNKSIYRISCTIESIQNNILISTAQLEHGLKATTWEPSTLDVPLHVTNPLAIHRIDAVSSIKGSVKLPIYPLSGNDNLLEMRVPTRIKKAVSPNKDISPFNSKIRGSKISFWKESIAVSWGVKNGKIIETDNSNKYDTFREYTIRDIRVFDSLQVGTQEYSGISALAVSILDDLLFAVCSEVINNSTIYTLKVFNARTPPRKDITYLQSLIDFEIDIGLNTTYGVGITESVKDLGFSSVDNKWLVVEMESGNSHYFELFYDYFTIDPQTQVIYALESYGTATLQVR
jgi:hypothetical protein